ncbi:MAG: cofactor-independent phosphoglycerate mutase [Christensenellales bacterium]
MKYIVVLGDGMADYRRGPLGVHTPLELAKKPNMDALAKDGLVGLVRTVDEDMKPGSDVANLSVLGYDPKTCYTGRAPLEALSLGIDMAADDSVFRMNFVTLSENENFSERIMEDYSAGEISSAEGRELVEAIKEGLGNGCMEFFAGTSYRNCAILRGAQTEVTFTPPHDITGKAIGEYLPKGEGSEIFTSLIERSINVLKDHPVNVKRTEEGKNPANAIWFWGKGTKPRLESFFDKYSLRGAVISAVDLLKGIAVGGGLEVIEVPGATGNLNTDFMGKAKACVEALENNDYVYLHFEAPDECGHQGDAEGKIKSIEKIDEAIGYILEEIKKKGEDFVMAVLPDHPTPLALKTHTADPVPFIVYNSLRPARCGLGYNEEAAQKGLYLSNGRALIRLMLKS